MPELRKQLCGLCGWNELIARTEDLKYLPPRFGFKQVDICVKCDALSESNPTQFNEYWEWAIRGTDPSVRPVTKEGPKAPITTDTGAAVTNFDKDSKPKPSKIALAKKMHKVHIGAYGPTELAAIGVTRAFLTGLLLGALAVGAAVLVVYLQFLSH